MLKLKAESAKKLEKLVGKLSPNAVDDLNALQSEEAQSSVVHIEENIDMALAIERSARASKEARKALQSAENEKKNSLDDARHDMAKAIQQSRKALQSRESSKNNFLDETKQHRRFTFSFGGASKMAEEAAVRRNIEKKKVEQVPRPASEPIAAM
jgi:hypothetical protein